MTSTRPTCQPTPDLRELQDDLHWLTAQLAKALAQAEETALRECGLSLRGYVVLSHVATGSAECQRSLAQGAGLDKSRLVGLLDSLETDGFVTRKPDPADRRARIVELTDKGRRSLESATAAVREVEERLFDDVRSEHHKVFFTVLRHLIQEAQPEC